MLAILWHLFGSILAALGSMLPSFQSILAAIYLFEGIGAGVGKGTMSHITHLEIKSIEPYIY